MREGRERGERKSDGKLELLKYFFLFLFFLFNSKPNKLNKKVTSVLIENL